MADFPPNLDDGEHWLPSDIIRDVGSRHPPPLPLPRRQHYVGPRDRSDVAAATSAVASDLDYVEGLARQLAALRLLEARAAAFATLFKPTPPSRRPPAHIGPFGPLEAELAGSLYDRPKQLGLFSGNGSGFGPRLRHGGLGGYDLVKLRERFVVPARPVVQRPAGGMRRESGGTGVFFPRVEKIKYDGDGKGSKKKPQAMTGVGGEQLSSTMQGGTKNGGFVVLKNEQTQHKLVHSSLPFHPQNEMALPADWTY